MMIFFIFENYQKLKKIEDFTYRGHVDIFRSIRTFANSSSKWVNFFRFPVVKIWWFFSFSKIFLKIEKIEVFSRLWTFFAQFTLFHIFHHWWVKTSIFRFFERFSKMKKIIIFSYQDNWNIKIHANGWKMWKTVNWAKNVHRSAVGKNFNYFDFSKSFWKWRKSSYSDIRTTQIQKFTHLDEKCENVWIEQKMSTGLRWGKTSNF